MRRPELEAVKLAEKALQIDPPPERSCYHAKSEKSAKKNAEMSVANEHNIRAEHY
jgi:hypothetical protein